LFLLRMVRRPAFVLLLWFALSASATTRYVTDRAAEPVKWQEWGKAAIERAQKEKRPLFVSIGFAASWDCQRMHREAFLNGENAEALNAYFVPVLLDRIEYPEVAEAYEAVLRSMDSKSGWPANLILTPNLEPFAGGHFLSTAELNRMLVINANRWVSERAAVIAEGKANVAKTTTEPRVPSDLDATTMEAVVDDIARAYEKDKTLDAMTAAFLFRYAARTKHENLRALAADSLRTLAAGPMRDQLGGGFHRCPSCYEKMLSDQALFALAYLDAWQITRDPDLAHVARTTLDYVIRDLVPSRGLFQSAQDAHSLVPGQGPVFVEGAFYLWTTDEITRLLGHETAGKIFKLYSMKDGAGNRPALEHPRFLHETYDELAAPLQKMLDVRQKRPAPFREGAMAGWNGLMISALARGSVVLDKPEYLEAATLAANSLQTQASTKLWNAKTKTLYRTESHTEALAEDYAMLVQGLLDLFESGHDVKWLDLAIALQQRQDQLFWNASLGRYTTGATAPEIVRGLLSERDAETPAVDSVAAMNLLRLAALTGNEAWRTRPAMIFQSFGGALRTHGAQHPQLAAAYESSLIAPSITVVVGDRYKQDTQDALRTLHQRWEPMRAVVFVPRKGAVRDRVVKALPFVGSLASDPEHAAVYVCANGACRRQ
jgi:uncharacterized protein YyaL (SSP411 family)